MTYITKGKFDKYHLYCHSVNFWEHNLLRAVVLKSIVEKCAYSHTHTHTQTRASLIYRNVYLLPFNKTKLL